MNEEKEMTNFSETKEQLNAMIQHAQDSADRKEDIIMTILKYMFIGKDYNGKEIIICQTIHSDTNPEDFELIKKLLEKKG